MNNPDTRRVAHAERQAARNHLDNLLIEWRRELWPNRHEDPIAHEDRLRRERALLAAEAHWGLGLRPIYGGICGA